MEIRTRALLASEGMEDLIPILEDAGLYKLEDLYNNEISEKDLFEIGVTKFFHQKKLLRLSTDIATGQVTFGGGIGSRRSSTGTESKHSSGPRSPPRSPKLNQEGGDHVSVHVMAVRSVGDKQLSEREHYVKVSLCDLVGTSVVPLENCVHKTTPARGPFPTFVSDLALPTTPAMMIPTNFRTHCIAFELKEKRMITDNKYIGLAVFPISYFHKFSHSTVVDSWFTLRSETNTSESCATGQIRIRFTVPGGCPKAVGKAYHVTGVNMKERKLRVTAFEAEIEQSSAPATANDGSEGGGGGSVDDSSVSDVNTSSSSVNGGKRVEDYFHSAPSTYITMNLDNAEVHQKSETQVVENSYTPCFDETFEYFGEIAKAKLLTVKLKQRATVVSHPTIGVIRIPLQFFLSQTNAADIDQVFEAYDHDDASVVRARIHLRIEVRARRHEERSVNFVRTASIKEQRFLSTEAVAIPPVTITNERSVTTQAPPSIVVERKVDTPKAATAEKSTDAIRVPTQAEAEESAREKEVVKVSAQPPLSRPPLGKSSPSPQGTPSKGTGRHSDPSSSLTPPGKPIQRTGSGGREAPGSVPNLSITSPGLLGNESIFSIGSFALSKQPSSNSPKGSANTTQNLSPRQQLQASNRSSGIFSSSRSAAGMMERSNTSFSTVLVDSEGDDDEFLVLESPPDHADTMISPRREDSDDKSLTTDEQSML